MPVKVFDVFAARHAARDLATPDFAAESDRRKRPRTAVHWPLRLRQAGLPDEIESVTQNLSSSGFYCLSPIPLTPGQLLDCVLRLPAHDAKAEQRGVVIDCKATVVRAEATSDGAFGIACRIEDYRLTGAGAAAR